MSAGIIPSMRAGSIGATLEAALRCHTARELAELAGVHPRTVERWRERLTEPSASILLRLMARSAQIRRVIAERLSEEWLDAEVQRLEAELATLRAKRHAGSASAPATVGRAAVATAPAPPLVGSPA